MVQPLQPIQHWWLRTGKPSSTMWVPSLRSRLCVSIWSGRPLRRGRCPNISGSKDLSPGGRCMKSLQARMSHRRLESPGLRWVGAGVAGRPEPGCCRCCDGPGERATATNHGARESETSGAEPPPEHPSVSGSVGEASDAQRQYEQAKRSLLPLGPSQIRDFRTSRDQVQAATYGGAPPILQNREVSLTVAPGGRSPGGSSGAPLHRKRGVYRCNGRGVADQWCAECRLERGHVCDQLGRRAQGASSQSVDGASDCRITPQAMSS